MTETENNSKRSTVFKSGLVSITFRQLSVERIVELVSQAGLEAIEWGGDVHVPPNDAEAAEKARELTAAAGLSVAAYGSYYRSGFSDPKEFTSVLETARRLGAPVIRVWAGKLGSQECSLEYRQNVVRDLCRIGQMAADKNIAVACEYHGRTLTDNVDSAWRLFEEVGPYGVYSYWQPLPGTPHAGRTRGLMEIMPWLRNLHVFHWHPETKERLPLAGGMESWREWLELVHKQAPGKEIHCLMEFVRDNDPDNFLKDAATLKKLLDYF